LILPPGAYPLAESPPRHTTSARVKIVGSDTRPRPTTPPPPPPLPCALTGRSAGADFLPAAQGEWIGLAVPAVAGALAAGLAGVAWMVFAE
jgi:hypothetical protein